MVSTLKIPKVLYFGLPKEIKGGVEIGKSGNVWWISWRQIGCRIYE
jgi:hypothetical protein